MRSLMRRMSPVGSRSCSTPPRPRRDVRRRVVAPRFARRTLQWAEPNIAQIGRDDPVGRPDVRFAVHLQLGNQQIENGATHMWYGDREHPDMELPPLRLPPLEASGSAATSWFAQRQVPPIAFITTQGALPSP